MPYRIARLLIIDQPKRLIARGLPPAARTRTPADERINSRCPTSAIATDHTTGAAISGVWNVMRPVSHAGLVPPGDGNSNTASPVQTNDRPSVTTIDGI